MIGIINYGAGNILSIKNMLKRAGHRDVAIMTRPEELKEATKLILPGVGHFDHGMKALKKADMVDELNEQVLEKKTPILGICLGLQLMTRGSEEGDEAGLAWLDAETRVFDVARMNGLKVPHMGWTSVVIRHQHALFENLPDHPRFYFVHSYHLESDNEEQLAIDANYGYDFVAGMKHGHIAGVQFHPEKSHKYGMALLKSFAEC